MVCVVVAGLGVLVVFCGLIVYLLEMAERKEVSMRGKNER